MITGADLRRTRKTADLTLRDVADLGGRSPGHLSRIESGDREVTPATIELYERATGLPIEASPDDHLPPTVEPVKRKDLIRLAGATFLGSFAADTHAARSDAATEAAQWLAWELWHRNVDGMHESEVSVDLRDGLARLIRQLQVLRSPDGVLRFAHPGLVDFHIACRVYSGIAASSTDLLARAQTSHATDLVIREFVQQDGRSSRSLTRWMTDGTNPVLRVNAAGILAKVPSPTLADNVITALRVDIAARDLYLTAVAHRVLALPWDDAEALVSRTHQAAPPQLAGSAAVRLAEELRNPRDAAARWCSAVLLHSSGAADREPIRAAVADALHTDSARENLRTMAALLAGVNPITA
jgi:transcriptional regulator with XRE-family HTH domain